MENKIFCNRIKIDGDIYEELKYYIIVENISETYCDLKCYGIRIEKESVCSGGGKIIDIKQINNIFYKLSDAQNFMKEITELKTEPSKLMLSIEKYIAQGINKAKRTA